MSYAAAIAALKPIVAAVTGIKHAMDGRPLVADALPLVYIEAGDGERTYNAQQVAAVYRVRVGLVVSRQGQTLAENEIKPFINSIPIAIDAGFTLGGGYVARVTSWSTDYPDWTEKPSRSIEFVVDITEKKNRGSV